MLLRVCVCVCGFICDTKQAAAGLVGFGLSGHGITYKPNNRSGLGKRALEKRGTRTHGGFLSLVNGRRIIMQNFIREGMRKGGTVFWGGLYAICSFVGYKGDCLCVL